MPARPVVLRWESLTKKAFDRLDRARCVVLVTCSPLEVHGPHLPLATDLLEGEGLLARTLRFLPERHRERTFLALPWIWAASDVVPQPGSIAFRPGTTVRVLEDLGRSLAAQGFRDVLVSNFHGGPRHFVAIERACERVSQERGIRMVALFSLMLSRLTGRGSGETLEDVIGALPGVRRADLAGDTHGGLLETSQLLALAGEWVDPEYKSLPRVTYESWLAQAQGGRERPQRRGLLGFLDMLASFRGNLRFFLTETYSGAPAGASAELGERCLDALGERAARAVAEVLDGTLPASACHSPLWRYRHFMVHPAMVRLADFLLGFRSPIA
ncbi:MAG TPA: creatininase family protein [Myxococcota bacterium]|nr:creatininase family protein [Myxococcota bacterium]